MEIVNKKNMIIKKIFIKDSYLISELKNIRRVQNIIFFLNNSDLNAALCF